jgi:uncharacterized protein
MFAPSLIAAIKRQYRLDWNGIHGSAHWARVRNNGLALSEHNGANVRVIEAFSVIHDSCRLSDGHDPDHGPRAAAFASSINATLLKLGPKELAELIDACTHHTRGITVGFSITVLTCWDADRLDLGRVGIVPKPEFLCTEIARSRDIIGWANRNSTSKTSP